MVVIGFFLDRPSPASQDQQYQAGRAPVGQIVPDSSATILQMATTLARQSQFSDGIKLLSLIPSDQSGYQTAQALSALWTDEIFQRGKDKIQQGQVRQGLTILHSIPPEDRPAEAAKLIAQAAQAKRRSTLQ